MSRTKLFTQAFFMLFHRGAAVMWLSVLAATVVEVAITQLLPLAGLDGASASLVEVILGVVIGALLIGILIVAVNAMCEGQPLGIAAGVRAGLHPFVPLLLVGFILAIPTWIMGELLTLVTAPMAKIDPNNISSAASSLALLLCCLLPLVLLAYLAVSFAVMTLGMGAERGVVLEDLGVGAAFRRAWGLLRSKFSDMVWISLGQLGVSLGLMVLFGCPLLFIFIAASGSLTAASAASAVAPYGAATAILFTVFTQPLSLFFSVIWTLAFRRWQGKTDAALPPMPSFQPPADLPPIGG